MSFKIILPHIARTFHYLLPNHCYLCSAVSPGFLCAGCRSDLPLAGRSCRCCALPLPDIIETASDQQDEPLCGDCLKHPKPFTRTLTAFEYGHPLDFLINRFKHHRHFVCGNFLSEHLLTTVATQYSGTSWPNRLMPVPLHHSRLLKRGFNQSHAIACQLHKHLGIPIDLSCRRIKRNPRQQGLKRKERLRNLKQAFAVTQPVDGAHIAVIDDVMTTGATVTELSQCLLDAGAARVDVWVLARVP